MRTGETKMAAFSPDVLDEFLSPDFLAHVCEKFHYGETQIPELRAVAEEMLPLMQKEAFWEWKEIRLEQQEKDSDETVIYENVVMSLGAGLDELQESYSGKGLLSQSYMLEVLASEILLKGYDAYNCYIKENTAWHVAKYHFPGSEEKFPLDMLPHMLREVTKEVTCNAAFCMLPKKSVAFVAELTQDEKVQCEAVCIGCQNTSCQNRIEDGSPEHRRIAFMTDMPLPYGYSRIFGKYH
ncbi:MAG: hypothetical protein NC231_00515 [Bacillus sp. (in: Bacteria)]|nr:hypothetical protein [Bacillus sp. (in: firmicutes)]MCM1426487.1 hypothetical protein [Eubacterium sp.]